MKHLKKPVTGRRQIMANIEPSETLYRPCIMLSAALRFAPCCRSLENFWMYISQALKFRTAAGQVHVLSLFG